MQLTIVNGDRRRTRGKLDWIARFDFQNQLSKSRSGHESLPVKHFSTSVKIDDFVHLGQALPHRGKKRRKRDSIRDNERELFFRPYDRHPTAVCSFQARVDNKFKFRGARNL